MKPTVGFTFPRAGNRWTLELKRDAGFVPVEFRPKCLARYFTGEVWSGFCDSSNPFGKGSLPLHRRIATASRRRFDHQAMREIRPGRATISA